MVVSLLGDRVWWALPFLYGPRWVAALLFLGILPSLRSDRRSAIRAGTLTLLVFAFGLLDVRVGLGRLEPAEAVPVRVVEMNAGSGSAGAPSAERVIAELTRVDADLVVIAECSEGLANAMGRVGQWNVRRSITSLCLATHYPIREWEVRDPMDIWKEGGSGAIARALLEGPGGPLRIGLVHLETPRDALDNYFDLSSIPTLGPVTSANMQQRERESRTAHTWILAGASFPTIVAGDFNLPVESAIYRRHWGALRNAFSRSGIGRGITKQTRRWGMRIDHILTSDEIITRRAFIGRDFGSDHDPVIADLSLPIDQRTRTTR